MFCALPNVCRNSNVARMHSSRMHTTCSSSCWGGGGLHQATVMAFWCGGLLVWCLLLWPLPPEDHTRRLPSIRRPPNQKAITEDHNRRPHPLEQASPKTRHPPDQAPPRPGTPQDQAPPWRPAARHAGIPPAMHAGIAPPLLTEWRMLG